MTKTTSALAVASGTLVTMCVAGGGIIGLAHAFDQPQKATSTLTTSHGVTTKSADTDPFAQKTDTQNVVGTPTTPPVTRRGAIHEAPPVVVPPAAPRILSVPVPTATQHAADERAWNDAHQWMHQYDPDTTTQTESEPTPTEQTAPAPQHMAPQEQQSPTPRHRAEPRGSDWGQQHVGSPDGRHSADYDGYR
ncbi:hypothetical protein [Parafrigoribacterium soli]|uniref:hypothetical protein n=1 Tax=Parafrigoribacterium soli TaxID=3144663 RepID=UPI0032EAD0DF